MARPRAMGHPRSGGSARVLRGTDHGGGTPYAIYESCRETLPAGVADGEAEDREAEDVPATVRMAFMVYATLALWGVLGVVGYAIFAY